MLCPVCGGKVESIDITFSQTDAYYQNKPLGLTPMQRRVLKILWDTDYIGFTTTGWKKNPGTSTATCMHYIRKKLKEVGAPYVIRSVRREGYVLQPIVRE